MYTLCDPDEKAVVKVIWMSRVHVTLLISKAIAGAVALGVGCSQEIVYNVALGQVRPVVQWPGLYPRSLSHVRGSREGYSSL